MTTQTHWRRLEPWPREEDLRPGLEARVHDPLWLLARQWQLGEFAAEDAGTPVRVSVDVELSPCSAYAPSVPAPGVTLVGTALDHQSTPVELLAEAERPAAATQAAWQVVARAGLDLLDLVLSLTPAAQQAATRNALLSNFPIPEPSAGELERWGQDRLRSWSILAGRAPNASLLCALLKTSTGVAQLLSELALDPGLGTALGPLLADWHAANAPLLDTAAKTSSSWVTERLTYAFSVAAGAAADQVVLAASDHDGTNLDWSSFDVVDAAKIRTAVPPPAKTTRNFTMLPSAVQYPGMPNQRYWELEDAAVNFGGVDCSTTDLARLLFLQFALAYGNDYFLVPAKLPVGNLCTTTNFTVVDSFGLEERLTPTNTQPSSAWRMYALGGGRSAEGKLWLPATLPQSHPGEPLEVLRLARDENANVTFGIETVVEDPNGQPIKRRDLEIPPANPTPPAAGPIDETLHYHLVKEPPLSWVALQNLAPKRALDTNVLVNSTGGGWGRILNGISSSRLLGETVPREGLEVTRRYEHARWLDGRTLIWQSRSRSVGRGEIDSGLRFDYTTRDG